MPSLTANVSITRDNLVDSIKLYNKGRRLLKQLEDIRCRPEVGITGTEAFAAAVAGTVMPREEYTMHLNDLLEGLSQSKNNVADGKKRLMTIGSISDDIDLIQLIEEDTKAVVVSENLCFGVRYEGNEIDETDDPVKALAEGYLGESTCPRMYGKYKDRLAILKEAIGQAGVEGVIMQNIRFCDLHGSENSLFERDLEAIGIPCLKLEREYGPLVEKGRVRMRVDAFLERIA